MTSPKGIQLRRTKGWRLQEVSLELNGLPALKVTRPGPYGNPLVIGMFRDYDAAASVRDYRKWVCRDLSVRSFEHRFGRPPTIEHIREHLGGKNLACFCGLSDPCHRNVLLELANG